MALFAACSEDTTTLPPDLGSYGSAGVAGSSGVPLPGSGGSGAAGSNGASGGPLPSSAGSGGSGLGAAGMPGGRGSVVAGSGGAGGSQGGAGGTLVTSPAGGSGGSFGSPAGASGRGGVSGGNGLAFGGGSGRGVGAGGVSGRVGSTTAGGAGKGVSAGGTGSGNATFSAVASIIQQHCALAACHGGGRSPRLTNNSSLYQTLTSTTVKECGGNHLVTASDPTNSALLMLPNWECDNLVMPQGCVDMPCLAADELATITAWIQAGAHNP